MFISVKFSIIFDNVSINTFFSTSKEYSRSCPYVAIDLTSFALDQLFCISYFWDYYQAPTNSGLLLYRSSRKHKETACFIFSLISMASLEISLSFLVFVWIITTCQNRQGLKTLTSLVNSLPPQCYWLPEFYTVSICNKHLFSTIVDQHKHHKSVTVSQKERRENGKITLSKLEGDKECFYYLFI